MIDDSPSPRISQDIITLSIVSRLVDGHPLFIMIRTDVSLENIGRVWPDDKLLKTLSNVHRYLEDTWFFFFGAWKRIGLRNTPMALREGRQCKEDKDLAVPSGLTIIELSSKCFR